MVQTVLWMVLPAVVWSALAWTVLDDPPRFWTRAREARRRRRETRAALVGSDPSGGGAGDPVARRHAPPQPPPDPFDVLTVQVQLGRVAAQMRALEADPRAWARARRLFAAQAAYDALLAEACRLAGVPVTQEWSPEPWGPTREPERFREEMELASRGWSW